MLSHKFLAIYILTPLWLKSYSSVASISYYMKMRAGILCHDEYLK